MASTTPVGTEHATTSPSIEWNSADVLAPTPAQEPLAEKGAPLVGERDLGVETPQRPYSQQSTAFNTTWGDGTSPQDNLCSPSLLV
jgi:hypothetical protein